LIGMLYLGRQHWAINDKCFLPSRYGAAWAWVAGTVLYFVAATAGIGSLSTRLSSLNGDFSFDHVVVVVAAVVESQNPVATTVDRPSSLSVVVVLVVVMVAHS